MASAGSRTKLTPIRAASVAAADSFADGSLDFVFVDADHSYEAAKADIAALRSKVKPGGIFCGHDCELRVTADNRSILSANISSDGSKFPARHFGMFTLEPCWPSTKHLAELLDCGRKQH